MIDEGLGSELEHMRDCLGDPARKNEAYHLELPSIGELPGNLWSLIAFACPKPNMHYGKWMDWLRWKLEMPNMITVNSMGVGGGLALLWKNDIDICIQSLS